MSSGILDIRSGGNVSRISGGLAANVTAPTFGAPPSDFRDSDFRDDVTIGIVAALPVESAAMVNLIADTAAWGWLP
jgi:hypothetical protein